MKTYTKIITALLVCIILLSCEKNYYGYGLDSTVFIEDSNNPQLPIYSEMGYNSFGVYIDRTPFISTQSIFPTKITVKNDTLSLVLSGAYLSRTMYERNKMELRFDFSDFSPKSYEELTMLNDMKIDLKTSKINVTMTTETDTIPLNILDGEFHFRRARKMFVDNENIKTIVSGKFFFKTVIQENPITFQAGRFDLGIGYNNFYYLSAE